MVLPHLGGPALSRQFAVFVPEHRLPVIVDVVDHRQAEAAVVPDVDVATLVNASAQTAVGVRLTQTRQTGIFVENPRQRAVNVQQF